MANKLRKTSGPKLATKINNNILKIDSKSTPKDLFSAGNFFINRSYVFKKKTDFKFLSISKRQNIVAMKGDKLVVKSKTFLCGVVCGIPSVKFKSLTFEFISKDNSSVIKFKGNTPAGMLTNEAILLSKWINTNCEKNIIAL